VLETTGQSKGGNSVNTFFPNPVEHAAVLLEACGSIQAARDAAATNCDFAPTSKEYRYWSNVWQALKTEAPCLAN
jgi:hypothetical protein